MSHIPAVKIFAALEREKIFSFLDGHYLSAAHSTGKLQICYFSTTPVKSQYID